jgi:hypothetical protein
MEKRLVSNRSIDGHLSKLTSEIRLLHRNRQSSPFPPRQLHHSPLSGSISKSIPGRVILRPWPSDCLADKGGLVVAVVQGEVDDIVSSPWPVSTRGAGTRRRGSGLRDAREGEADCVCGGR